jgi:hypothetical protein
VSRLVVRLLLRLEGGTAAVCQAISRTLDADDQENLAHLQEALETIGLLGPRATSLRPALVRRRDISDAYWRLVIDRALDAIDGKGEPPADPSDEAEVLARSSAGDDEKVARLHELGEAGARAMLRVAAETRDADALLVRIAPIADAPLRDVIRDAAGATGSDPASALRRRGAAVLASLLPPADAIALLTRLHDRGDTAEIALESLCRVESGSPGSVPVALAARLLRDGDGHRDWDGLPLAERIGPRMLAADADLVPELRWVRDTGVLYDVHREAALGSPGAAPAAQASPAMWLRCAGAVALWRLTRHEDEALPLFRSLLEHPERIGRRDDDQIPWTTVGEVLAEMTLGDEDVAAIVVTLRAASAHVHHDADESDPGGTDAVAGAVVPLCAVLRRLGPRAAPAVPALRVALPHRVGARGEPVVATLVAIGSAAREAIPDIRVWAAHDERCRRVASDAIRAIESAPR